MMPLMMNMQPEHGLPCTLLRRSLAIIYDSVVVLALWFAATAVLLPLSGLRVIEPGQQYYFLYPPYLAVVNWMYLAVSWRSGGQTLGMKAWRIYLHTVGGRRLSWQDTALRYLFALMGFAAAGVGFLSSLFRSDGLTWHDRATNSQLWHQPKKNNSAGPF